MFTSRCLAFALAVVCLSVISWSSVADAQTCSGPSAADDVVNKIKKVAAKHQGKFKVNAFTGEKEKEEDDMKGAVKKLQASNPISALVSALQSEHSFF